MVDFNDYQERARNTRLPTATTAYAVMNLGGEAGEVLSLFAKFERDGPKPRFKESLIKELGDVLWHISVIADDFQLDLQHIALTNLNKLEDRKARNALQGSGDNR